MGIFSSRDLFSPKFTTAIIIDANNRWFPIPIKNILGDFFIAEIENELYVFKLDPSREKTYRAKGIRTVKILLYDINHFMPISPENNQALENFLRDNRLPKVNHIMLRALDYIGKRETPDESKFEKLNLKELFDEVATGQEDYATEAKNFETFFNNLGVKEIVTPTKKISEFLVDDLITTSPQFYGMVVKQFEKAKAKHSRVTNEPKTAKTNWIVIVMILGLVGLALGGILYLNSTGAFSHLLPSLPNIGPSLPGTTGSTKLTMSQIAADYPTPKSLVDAVSSHAISCTQLPDDAVKMVNNPVGGGIEHTCP